MKGASTARVVGSGTTRSRPRSPAPVAAATPSVCPDAPLVYVCPLELRELQSEK